MQTLVLHLLVGADDHVQVLPALLGNGGGLTVLPLGEKRPHRATLLAAGAAVLDALRNAALRIAAGGPGAAQGLVSAVLQPAGASLADTLLDAALLDRLHQDPQLTHVTFWVDPSLNGVPFESAFLHDDFLGFRFATGREVIARGRRPAPPPPSSQPTPALVIRDPQGNLPPEVARGYDDFHRAWLAARRHARIHFHKPGTLGLPRVLALLAQHDIVNLVGHHTRPETDPGRNGFPLGDGTALTAGDLVAHFQTPALRPPALFFSMGCDSGLTEAWHQAWADSGPLHGLVDAALRLGIRHYIGSLIEFPAVRGSDFFAPFYDALLSGQSVGGCVRRVRHSLRGDTRNWRDGNTALGLGLVLYGDPSRPWFSAGAQPVGADPAVLCEHPDPADGRPCGRAAVPAERGFAQRRCLHHLEDLTCSAGHPVHSRDDLRPCAHQDPLHPGCANTVCARCPGSGLTLCWEHACHQGHPILAGLGRRCRDPHGQHPAERRSVCPHDPGFSTHLCGSCLERAQNPRPSA